MAEQSKDGTSFLRKMVRLVGAGAGPTAPAHDASTGFALERSELKVMIERKRRNDFVRKREFDMLRRLRREGLSSAQLAALGHSRLDDSDERLAEAPPTLSGEAGVKAKIDEIEQAMVGAAAAARAVVAPPPCAASAAAATAAAAPAAQALEVSEMAQDPLLDEAVIAFANGEFAQCEQALTALTADGGARAGHAETWLVRLDLYRATGAQAAFEALAAAFAQRFGRSPPQWFSLPQRLAAQQPRPAAPTARPGLGWSCPAVLDAAAVQRLQAYVEHAAPPQVVDWSGLQHVQLDAVDGLTALLQAWAAQPHLGLHWLGAALLLQRLREATPAGVRDTPPALWLLRLQALRLLHQVQAFDEAAIDYCITYEVSPPPWEPPRCRVRLSDGPPSQLSSSLQDDGAGLGASRFESSLQGADAVAELELAGQLAGDIGPTLRRLEQQLGVAALVHINCARLVRVDFNAAGDLLNWVLARRQEQRSLVFLDAHRLVALLLGAMSISEHARVRVHST